MRQGSNEVTGKRACEQWTPDHRGRAGRGQRRRREEGATVHRDRGGQAQVTPWQICNFAHARGR